MKFVKLSSDATVPVKKSTNAAGYDMCSSVDLEIRPGESVRVPTGLAIALPEMTFGMMTSRSGLASRKIVVGNAPGIIDCDYRGEVQINIHNNSNENFKIKKGDRIAQMLVMPYMNVTWDEVSELDETDRGTGGFGSTGIK